MVNKEKTQVKPRNQTVLLKINYKLCGYIDLHKPKRTRAKVVKIFKPKTTMLEVWGKNS